MKPILKTDSIGMELGIRLATMVEKVLIQEVPPSLSSDSITKILVHTFGVQRSRSNTSAQRLLEALRDKCGRDMTDYLGIKKETALRLVGLPTGHGAVRNPMHNLAALYVVSDAMEGFEEKLALATESEAYRFMSENEQSVIANPRKRKKRLSGDDRPETTGPDLKLV